ncbi:FadR/GntR family transcriptional regulator [Novosphingobium bradum]|uniref:FadR/GntR family transcriptional regulator n=1 Tax=Novosphingobium bradum TaxID=1737444 RepID=A0ABV7IPS2_9SPHN
MIKRQAPPRVKVAERIAAELRREIVTGNLRPGDRLHPERQLQEQFNISRPTLREALRMLESESLIEVTRGQRGGACVTALNPDVLARQVGVCLQIEGVTLQDVWQCRTIMEPAAAALLTASGNRAAIAAMEENIAAAAAAEDDPVRYGQLTSRFSHILTEYCGNKTIHILSTLIAGIVDRQTVDVTVKTYARAGVDRMRKWNVRSRERMVEIVRSGDAAEAQAHWHKHLEVAGEVVFSSYRAQMPIDVVQLPAAAE